MIEYIKLWAAKAVVDATIAFVVFAIFIILPLLYCIPGYIRQLRCKHERVHETRSCDAICNQCGKNLGFIQKWRDARTKKGTT